MLGLKIEAASFFTGLTGNLGVTSPLPSDFLPAARTAVVNVVDAATEASSEQASFRHFARRWDRPV